MPAPVLSPAAELLELTPDNADTAALLLGPDAIEAFRSDLASGAVVAVAATRFGRPAGLAVARFHGADTPASIWTLAVVPRLRNRGIGSCLLGALEASLLRAGARAAAVLFARPAGGGTLPVDRVLAKRGWPPAEKLNDIFTIRWTLDLLRESWMQHRLPRYFELVPWCEATPSELEAIRGAEPGLDDPEYISPLIAGIDGHSSMLLRHRAGVAGWMVNRRPLSDLVVFDRFYIYRPYQGLRGGVPLLAESIRRVLAGEPARVKFCVPAYLPKHNRFVRKLLGDYFTAETEEWAAEKSLSVDASARQPAVHGEFDSRQE